MVRMCCQVSAAHIEVVRWPENRAKGPTVKGSVDQFSGYRLENTPMLTLMYVRLKLHISATSDTVFTALVPGIAFAGMII